MSRKRLKTDRKSGEYEVGIEPPGKNDFDYSEFSIEGSPCAPRRKQRVPRLSHAFFMKWGNLRSALAIHFCYYGYTFEFWHDPQHSKHESLTDYRV